MLHESFWNEYDWIRYILWSGKFYVVKLRSETWFINPWNKQKFDLRYTFDF